MVLDPLEPKSPGGAGGREQQQWPGTGRELEDMKGVPGEPEATGGGGGRRGSAADPAECKRSSGHGGEGGSRGGGGDDDDGGSDDKVCPVTRASGG